MMHSNNPNSKLQTPKSKDPRGGLPSVTALLEEPVIKDLILKHSRALVLDAIHETLDWYRANLKSSDDTPALECVVGSVAEFLARNESERIRKVVNATGIILHTGLGRAVLPQRAVDALAQLNGCCNLQIDLETGLRGKRMFSTEALLCNLTGAEAAVVVNNNAAATFLILSALCKGKEVVVSRGQLIEIGGSFRLPDCIHESGAIMVEVGTTNKTHLRDYENAITENTGALLRVNPSNYRVIGFSKEVPVAELVALKKRSEDKELQPLVLDDLGCGALIDLSHYGLPHEPTVPESVAAGADIVCFSGDKLIGGPQAGIIVGKKHLIKKIKKHPLTRMLRVCKLTDMALEQALRLFLEPETLIESHPTLRMLTTPVEKLKKLAIATKRKIDAADTGLNIRVIDGESEVGGGSLPGVPIPTYLLAVRGATMSSEKLNALLRRNEPPIIARIKDDEVLLDMRTMLPGEDKYVVEFFARCGGRKDA